MFLINGQVSDRLAVSDRGLNYGDGLFETLAVSAGRALLRDAHLARLADGCQRLGMLLPDMTGLEQELDQLCHDVERAVIKIIITRGEGARGYRPDAGQAATRILGRFPWPDYPNHYYTEGVAARVCQTRLGAQPALAGIKHLNRLEQVLARNEWQEEVQEGLMMDMQGHLIEGTMSNLFVVIDDRLHTPELDQCGVRGVMREQVLSWCRETGRAYSAGRLTEQALDAATEVFLTNSLIGVWPVRQVDHYRFMPGPVSRAARQALCRKEALVC